MDDPIDRLELLRELGFGHPEAVEAALAVLFAAGLTNPRKRNIAASKREKVREALEAALLRRCPRCARTPVPPGRTAVPVEDSQRCDLCGGSTNRLALQRAFDACRRAGISRVVVVGGAPGVHAALRADWAADIELRIVDGTERHTQAEADAHLAWGHFVLVWAPTALLHRVSERYTKPRRPHVVMVHRRGIEALADALAEAARAR